MQRVNHSTAQPDRWGPDKPGYVEGEPGVTPATVFTADAANAFQEELCNVVEGFGGALDPSDNSQVYQVIKAIADAVPDAQPPIVTTDFARLTASASQTFTKTNTFSSTVNLNGQVNVNHDVTMKATLNLRSGGATPANIDADGGIHADGALSSDSGLDCHGITSHGDITAADGTSIYANGGIVSGHTVNSDQDITVTRDATIGRSYKYSGTPTRYKTIALHGVVLTGNPTYVQPIAGGTGAYWVGDTATDYRVAFPLNLPTGNTLTEVAMLSSNHVGGEFNQVYVQVTNYPDWNSGAEPHTVFSTSIFGQTPADVNDFDLTKATGSLAIDASNNSYQIVCNMKSSNHIRGLRLGFIDAGLRND